MPTNIKQYLLFFRNFLKKNSKSINKKINTVRGLTLFRDYYYPSIKNVNFEAVEISSISKDLSQTKRLYSENEFKISKLKNKFSNFKSNTIKEKKIINLEDAIFWSELLDVSIDEMINSTINNNEALNDIEYIHYYIPQDRVIETINKITIILHNLAEKFSYKNNIVLPIVVDYLTSSILYVSFEANFNKEVTVKYHMTYYIYSKLLDIIFFVPREKRTLVKTLDLGVDYNYAQTTFFKQIKRIYWNHKDVIKQSMKDIKIHYPKQYKEIANLSDYLKMTLLSKKEKPLQEEATVQENDKNELKMENTKAPIEKTENDDSQLFEQKLKADNEIIQNAMRKVNLLEFKNKK